MTQPKITQRTVSKTRAALSRSAVRKLSMESLERRCPLDAAGIAGGFEQLAIIGSERVSASVAAPAITCYAEEFSRLPQSTPTQRGEYEAFPDSGRVDRGGELQGPRHPDETVILDPEAPPSGFVDGKQEPPVGSANPAAPATPDLEEPAAGRPLFDLDAALWRPEPVRFDVPQRPADSIGLDPQLDAEGDGPMAAGFAPRASGISTRGTGPLTMAAARWQTGQRSETSLSHTRYFDSSDLHADLCDNLQGESSSLLAFAPQGMSEEIGIAIGSPGATDAYHHAGARRSDRGLAHSRPTDSDTQRESTTWVRPRIEANEADLAIVALVSAPEGRTRLAMSQELLVAVCTPTLPSGDAAENLRVGIADESEADLQPRFWQQTADLLAGATHWAVVGLLLSNHISSSVHHSRRRIAQRVRRMLGRFK